MLASVETFFGEPLLFIFGHEVFEENETPKLMADYVVVHPNLVAEQSGYEMKNVKTNQSVVLFLPATMLGLSKATPFYKEEFILQKEDYGI